MPTASGLRASLVAAGLNVRTWPGWETRGGAWKFGKPIGVMEHHTALPVPFPVGRLAGEDQGRIKANINVKPDGVVWLIAYEACNYSSGVGALQVLNEVRAGVAPKANALERDLPDSINGNPYFWNVESDHVGDGRPISAVQHDAIVTMTRVVIDHFGLQPTQVISHAEWSRRKRDPYWDGSLRAIEAIREQLEDDMTPAQEAKLDALLVTANNMPTAVWSAWFGKDENRRTAGAVITQAEAASVAALAALQGHVDTDNLAQSIADALDDDLAHAVADVLAARLLD